MFIVTRGLGGGVNSLVTRGYASASAPPTRRVVIPFGNLGRTLPIGYSPPTVFAPSSIGGLQLDLDPDNLSLADGNFISSFADSSGHAHTFTQATSGLRPTWRASALNGHAVARFDYNRGDVLNGGDLSAIFPASATLFVVATLSTAEYSLYSTSPSNATYWRYAGDGDGYLGTFRTTRITQYPLSMPTSGSHVFTLISSSINYEFLIDGVSQGTQPPNYNGGTAHALGQNGSNSFGGDVARVLIYDSVLSSTNRSAVESYLATRYGL